jgi:UDP-N-acetylglucosamine 1-carboxyvinyltransferase
VAAVAVAGGELTIDGARPEHMTMVLERFVDMGLEISTVEDRLHVVAADRMRAIDVATLPYPGIATDYKPLIITMLSVADGVGIVTENLYPGRFRYVEELQRLGADVRTSGHHAVVRGVPRLSGAPVRAHDIRAGAAMVVAGLAAEGETLITGVHHIDRGYDDLVGRLAAVGATIERV